MVMATFSMLGVLATVSMMAVEVAAQGGSLRSDVHLARPHGGKTRRRRDDLLQGEKDWRPSPSLSAGDNRPADSRYSGKLQTSVTDRRKIGKTTGKPSSMAT